MLAHPTLSRTPAHSSNPHRRSRKALEVRLADSAFCAAFDQSDSQPPAKCMQNARPLPRPRDHHRWVSGGDRRSGRAISLGSMLQFKELRVLGVLPAEAGRLHPMARHRGERQTSTGETRASSPATDATVSPNPCVRIRVDRRSRAVRKRQHRRGRRRGFREGSAPGIQVSCSVKLAYKGDHAAELCAAWPDRTDPRKSTYSY